MSHRILVINPGGASTKIALFEDEREVATESIELPKEVAKAPTLSQLEVRVAQVKKFMEKHGVDPAGLSAVVARGGAFRPMPSGTYRINDVLIEQIKSGVLMTDHASNLGALIAHQIARPLGIPAYFVDPVCVDEFEPESRLSGHPLLPRVSLSHALNIKYVARLAARDLGRPYHELNLVITHLGTGITVSAHRKGRMIDVNNANDGGPFSPQRTGSLPVTGLAKLCFSGKYSLEEVMRMLVKEGGVYAYLGTYSMKEVEERARSGDREAALVRRAMIIQIAKEMGAMAARLSGRVDAQVITGGIARSEWFVGDLREMVEWIAPVLVYPGEMEMEALAAGALRVLMGQEPEREYTRE